MKRQEVSELMDQVLTKWRFDLKREKCYEFVKSNLKAEALFGTLSRFDFDIENRKVNNLIWLII